jgi:uncharacterized membrane protein
MEIFSKVGGQGAFTIAHVIVAMMWMGLLWFFNFVQTPAFAEMEAGSRNDAFDKLTWRALWWFRWSAAATVVFGLLIIGIAPKGTFGKQFWVHSAQGPTLAIGILFGLTMFLNVWLVIWPQQQVVITNARNLKAGGEANPNAAAAGRAGAMASRQNTIFSLPLLVFMVGASHFYNVGPTFGQTISSGKCVIYLIIGIVVLAVLELNSLGLISGRGNSGLNMIYESHKNAMYTGIALIVGFYVLAEIILKA